MEHVSARAALDLVFAAAGKGACSSLPGDALYNYAHPVLNCAMAADFPQLTLKQIYARFADPAAPLTPQRLRSLQSDSREGVQKLYRVLARRVAAQEKERARLDQMLDLERRLWDEGIVHVAGVDEVGIGPLAGPVVAAAVVFPPWAKLAGIDDSKRLNDAVRRRLDLQIRAIAAVGLGVVGVEEVDRLNVYHAGLRAMQRAVGDLPIPPQHVLVDARTIPEIAQPQEAYIKGDTLSLSIAAASIVAKVHRDRLMTELDARYPGYGFALHKGYPTPAHQLALRKLGPCAIHRRSFDFIGELCGEYGRFFYEQKVRAAKIATRAELSLWESGLEETAGRLSGSERRKLHLLKTRLRKRLGA